MRKDGEPSFQKVNRYLDFCDCEEVDFLKKDRPDEEDGKIGD